jgi:hypothetical protein
MCTALPYRIYRAAYSARVRNKFKNKMPSFKQLFFKNISSGKEGNILNKNHG